MGKPRPPKAGNTSQEEAGKTPQAAGDATSAAQTQTLAELSQRGSTNTADIMKALVAANYGLKVDEAQNHRPFLDAVTMESEITHLQADLEKPHQLYETMGAIKLNLNKMEDSRDITIQQKQQIYLQEFGSGQAMAKAGLEQQAGLKKEIDLLIKTKNILFAEMLKVLRVIIDGLKGGKSNDDFIQEFKTLKTNHQALIELNTTSQRLTSATEKVQLEIDHAGKTLEKTIRDILKSQGVSEDKVFEALEQQRLEGSQGLTK